jgi:hypothetical protein
METETQSSGDRLKGMTRWLGLLINPTYLGLRPEDDLWHRRLMNWNAEPAPCPDTTDYTRRVLLM